MLWTIIRKFFGIYRHPRREYEIAARWRIPASSLDRSRWVSIDPKQKWFGS